MKLKWKNAEVPSGNFRSFERRGWPSACYVGDKEATMITCADQYVPANVRIGKHAELRVLIAVWRSRENDIPTFDWRRMTQSFATLAEAKDAAEKFIKQHPEVRSVITPKS